MTQRGPKSTALSEYHHFSNTQKEGKEEFSTDILKERSKKVWKNKSQNLLHAVILSRFYLKQKETQNEGLFTNIPICVVNLGPNRKSAERNDA